MQVLLRLPAYTLEVLVVALDDRVAWMYSWILYLATALVLLNFSSAVLLNTLLIIRPTMLDDVQDGCFLGLYQGFILSTSLFGTFGSYAMGEVPIMYSELVHQPPVGQLGFFLMPTVTAVVILCLMIGLKASRAHKAQ